MSTRMSDEAFTSLVAELCRLPKETEWVEFKENNANPEEIGEYVSALANSAALAGKTSAYVLWGIEDGSHRVVGTTFSPVAVRVKGQELDSWLLQLLTPKIEFQFHEGRVEGQCVVILEICRSVREPVRFQGQEFIRVGSYKKKLKEFPEKERQLWRIFDQTPFEDGIAGDRLSADEVFKLLDYPSYFDLMELPLPEGRDGILNALKADELIRRGETGEWCITNLGAILFARKLDAFRGLRRKALRIIQYKGTSRVETLREHTEPRGYATGFEDVIAYVNGQIRTNEVIEQALRSTVPMYPELAIRELVANALIHQDFFVTGAGPMIEIFDDRMEITNPGAPIVATDRFLDSPPKSRNEALAAMMRRIGACEERGSGVDKVVSQTEFYQLPAPLFEAPGDNTRAVLFSHRPLTKMDKTDRVRACYLHACLKYVNREYLTNSSVRERFGIEPQNIAAASRLIKEAVDDGVIAPYDADAAPKLMKYVPWWAVPESGT